MVTGDCPSKRLKLSDDQSTDLETEEYDDAVSKMATEWKKGKRNRSLSTIKELMMKTGTTRRNWITHEKPLIAEVMAKFPCFKSSRMVC